jgi:hypothetical protein
MAPQDETLARAVAAAARQRLEESAKKIQHCLDQLTEEQVWWRPTPSQNSIANLILHLCGNVQQWLVAGITEERDVRNRPAEFSERRPVPRAELSRRLIEVVARAAGVLDGLTAKQLLQPRRIQGFDVTVLTAIFDAVPHFQGHTQEIVSLTRLQLGDAYHFHFVPATPEQGAPA